MLFSNLNNWYLLWIWSQSSLVDIFEALCSPMRTASNRWFQLSSVLIITHDHCMWFFCNISFSAFFYCFKWNTHDVYAPTYTCRGSSLCITEVSCIVSRTHTILVCSLLYFSVMVIIILRDSGSLSSPWFTTALQRWKHIIHQLPVEPIVLKLLVNDFPVIRTFGSEE